MAQASAHQKPTAADLHTLDVAHVEGDTYTVHIRGQPRCSVMGRRGPDAWAVGPDVDERVYVHLGTVTAAGSDHGRPD